MFLLSTFKWVMLAFVSSVASALAGPMEDAMNADRAFAKMAQTKGVAEAFGAYAAKDGIRFTPGNPERGPQVIKASIAKDFAEGGKLNWEPQEGTSAQDGSLVVSGVGGHFYHPREMRPAMALT